MGKTYDNIIIGILEGTKAAINALNGLTSVANPLGASFTNTLATVLTGTIDSSIADTRNEIAFLDDSIAAIGASGERSRSAISKLFSDIRAGAEEAGKRAAEIFSGGGSVSAATKFADDWKAVPGILEGLETPLDKFNDKMEQLNTLILNGGLEWQEYQRAAGQAFQNLEAANGSNSLQRAQAVTKDNGGENAVTKFEAETRLVTQRNDPQARIAAGIEQAQILAQKQLEQQIKIANALAGAKALGGI